MTDNPVEIVPRFALLGVCERGAYRRLDPPSLSYIDVLGLRHVVLSHVYPFVLSGLSLAVAVYGAQYSGLGHMILRDRSGNQVFRLDLSISVLSSQPKALPSEQIVIGTSSVKQTQPGFPEEPAGAGRQSVAMPRPDLQGCVYLAPSCAAYAH